jgi:3-methyladenine DNA glycosylase AlkD
MPDARPMKCDSHSTATGVQAAIHRELTRHSDPDRAVALRRFFKTAPGEYGAGDRFLGLTVPAVRVVSARYSRLQLHDLEALLQSPWHEERLLALVILVRQYESGTRTGRAAIYRLYLRNTHRINNWDLVDCSAGQIVGAHLCDGSRAVLQRLARSRSIWERRVAIIATGFYIRRGEFGETLRIARTLLADPHDLIHKAVGWMLREVGKRDRAVEEEFLRRYAHRMPRTMLRYAIERFPESVRRRYLLVPSAS